MIFIESLIAMLSTYSIIPMPQLGWNERNMKYAICFLPVVGIFCGGLLFLWQWFCTYIGIGNLLFAAVAVCIPVIVTGGIHVDGYMDTIDALASHQSRERKLEIMKDSSCGAFAVIYCVVYFLLNTAFVCELYTRESIAVICPVFVMSRALSALCAVNMPGARKSGMLSAYTQNSKKAVINAAAVPIALLSACAMILISPPAGTAAVCTGLIWVIFYCFVAKKQFGGVTGDTAGFFLQLCELFCIMGALIGVLLK